MFQKEAEVRSASIATTAIDVGDIQQARIEINFGDLGKQLVCL